MLVTCCYLHLGGIAKERAAEGRVNFPAADPRKAGGDLQDVVLHDAGHQHSASESERWNPAGGLVSGSSFSPPWCSEWRCGSKEEKEAFVHNSH